MVPGASPDWAGDPASDCVLETLVAANLLGQFDSLRVT